MSKFRQVLTAYYEIVVEAKDMYEADKKISKMSEEDIIENGRLTYIDFETSELPENY